MTAQTSQKHIDVSLAMTDVDRSCQNEYWITVSLFYDRRRTHTQLIVIIHCNLHTTRGSWWLNSVISERTLTRWVPSIFYTFYTLYLHIDISETVTFEYLRNNIHLLCPLVSCFYGNSAVYDTLLYHPITPINRVGRMMEIVLVRFLCQITVYLS